tara:strand:+ start:22546 stop:23643 length:1098 start_codon:yes stop_codon:yes gene_type:complete
MRIGLGSEALSAQLTGIGRYTWELARRLPNVAGIHSVKLFREGTWYSQAESLLDSAQPNRARLPNTLRKLINKREFARRLFHGPNFFFPAQAENAVITVHDLSVFRYPETHPAQRLLQFEKEFQRSIDAARHIITDTEYIKNELVEMFGLPSSRITAVPLGVDESFFIPSSIDQDELVLEHYMLRGCRYCLCVATIEPRKGLDLAVAAFLELHEKVRKDVILVIVGASGWKNAELHRVFESASEAGVIKFLGFVDDNSLRALYRNCTLFIYPSLYEGFGLPVLEALASSVPALVSDRSCLPEVSGGVSMSVDVKNHRAFREAIEQGLDDEAWRGEAIKKGLALARRLNWQRCAEETAKVYSDLMD